MNRKGFVRRLCLTVGFRVFSPRKEHQCLTWKLNAHTKGFFTAHVGFCLTVEKFITPGNMYLWLWSKASAREEQRYTFCLWENGSSRILLQKDRQKTHVILQSEISKFGLWIASRVLCLLGARLYPWSMFVTSGKALKLFVPLFSIWKSGIILAAYLTSKGYARISRLKFAKCLEINGGKNLYAYKVLLSFPSVYLFSLSLCYPRRLSEHYFRSYFWLLLYKMTISYYSMICLKLVLSLPSRGGFQTKAS